MFLPYQVKKHFFQQQLNKQLKNSVVNRVHLQWDEIQTIGILFDATSIQHVGMIKEVANQFKKEKKKVYLLGYINSSNPNNILSFPFFSRKNINWKAIPKNFEVQKFTDKNLDVLFNAYLTPHLPLVYTSSVSNAKQRALALLFLNFNQHLTL